METKINKCKHHFTWANWKSVVTFTIGIIFILGNLIFFSLVVDDEPGVMWMLRGAVAVLTLWVIYIIIRDITARIVISRHCIERRSTVHSKSVNVSNIQCYGLYRLERIGKYATPVGVYENEIIRYKADTKFYIYISEKFPAPLKSLFLPKTIVTLYTPELYEDIKALIPILPSS